MNLFKETKSISLMASSTPKTTYHSVVSSSSDTDGQGPTIQTSLNTEGTPSGESILCITHFLYLRVETETEGDYPQLSALVFCWFFKKN